MFFFFIYLLWSWSLNSVADDMFWLASIPTCRIRIWTGRWIMDLQEQWRLKY